MAIKLRLLTLRVATGALVAAAIVAGSGGVAQGAGTLPPEVLPYSPRMAFRQPVAAHPRIDPRSGAIVRRLAQNLRENKAHVTTDNDVPPVYRVSPADPFLNVQVGGRDIRFRVPRHALTGTGQDHPLVLLDRNHPDFGTFVELRLYKASIDWGSRRIHASGAGLFRYSARGSGRPFLGHGTGSGLSILAGLIRPRDIASGRIRHAVRFAYSNIDFLYRAYRPPAITSDQPSGGYTRDQASAMEMGMRLQLDPRVNCDRRTVPSRSDTSRETRFLRILCHALQDYGMIVTDGTAAGVMVLHLENEGTAPWGRLLGSTNNGNYSFIVRDRTTPGDGLRRDATSGIPWGRMRVIAR